MKLRSAARAIALCLAAATTALGVQVHSSSLGDTAAESSGKVGEVLLVWDISAYLWFDLQALVQQADDVVRRVAERFPEGVKIGLATFNEKPKYPDPDPYIHCYKTEVPLTTNHSVVAEKIQTLKSHGGRDSQNSQYDALYYGAKSPKVGWSEGVKDSKGRCVVRIVVMFTGTYHYYGKQDGMPEFEDHGEEQCGKYSYPDIIILGDVYQDASINLLFILSPYRDSQLYIRYYKTRSRVSKTWKDSKGKGFRAAPILMLDSPDEVSKLVEGGVARLLLQLASGGIIPSDPTNKLLSDSVVTG